MNDPIDDPVVPSAACESCALNNVSGDFVVALAGNPNTGKSTVFNSLTGLHQHTGNWPGKTVTRAEGVFAHQGSSYRLVDLPGTYSLLSTSFDEEVARDFILFGKPDVTVIVVDATRLERNLNLVLQILEITSRVVVCVNLMDESRRHGLTINDRQLSRELGVPVVPASARSGEGIATLVRTVHEVATGQLTSQPYRMAESTDGYDGAVNSLVGQIEACFVDVPNARWVALRLLEGDERMADAVASGELGSLSQDRQADPTLAPTDAGTGIVQAAASLRWDVGEGFHDSLMETLYGAAARIADRVVTRDDGPARFDLDHHLDRLLTSRWTGFPIMLLLLAGVLWLTVEGANVPSALMAALLLDTIHPALKELAASLSIPWWLDGALIDGLYLALAWVVSVMLPPMAIFFPLFTLLEDFGYLPRVAFNLDRLFRRAGAHGKQALTMSMGFGCNAAGIIAARVIDSPRERLIAMLTNNFALCNGRWPTQILIATIFIGGLVPAHVAGLAAASTVVGVAVLGIVLTFLVSWLLSHTLLRGEVSTFSLELPPYRPPRVLRTIYTSLIDRTLFVLWRAILFAAPAGVVIWVIANVRIDDLSLAQYFIQWMDPFALFIGLNGIILLAYAVAIPANEIVLPTVFMLTVMTAGVSGTGEGAGVMFELESVTETAGILQAGGWSLLTGINLLLFSLVHNPCTTTLYTIYKETGSVKWTTIAALLPLSMGVSLCFLVAQVWRLLGLDGIY
jgi:ferrous iron transport protein B